MEIVELLIADLVPDAENARTHSDRQVAQIGASITEFGFTNPVMVDGKNKIIAGHGRVLAAALLGLEKVPCIVLSHLTELQRRAYVIADNKLALNAGWDEDLLASVLVGLEEAGVDLSVIGFDEQELDAAMRGAGDIAGLAGDDHVPDFGPVVSQLGDLWLLGDHRILCGDACILADVERVMDGAKASMVWTDPPYNVDYRNSAKDKMRSKGGKKAGRRIMNDNLGSGFGLFLFEACEAMMAVTDGAFYICMSSSEIHTLRWAFDKAGGKWSTFIIWVKHAFTLGRADYQRQYEPIMHGWNEPDSPGEASDAASDFSPMLYGWRDGEKHYWIGDRNQADVWFFDRPFRNDLHPTMKPVELVERAIQNSSPRNGLVLDPFGGAGSVVIACQKLTRRARVIELDPQYVDVIVRRWEEWTGQVAVLEADGVAFTEHATARGADAVA